MDATTMVESTIKGLTGVHLSIVRQNQAPAPTIENRHPEPRYGYLLAFSNHPEVKEKWEKHSHDRFFGEVFQVVEAFCQWYREKYILKGKRGA